MAHKRKKSNSAKAKAARSRLSKASKWCKTHRKSGEKHHNCVRRYFKK